MAFLQSAPPRQPIFRAPAVVLWLIAGLAGLHALRLWLPSGAAQAMVYEYALIPARYSNAFAASQADLIASWRGTVLERAIPFVSYMGLHNDWTHLVINSLWLLAFGPVVARRLGSLLFLLFFLVCGVAGAGLMLAFLWGAVVPVVGASAAISGLMGAAIRMLPGRFAWAHPGEAPLMPLLSRTVLGFTAVWMVTNLAFGTLGLGLVEPGQQIAWQAHLGGYFAGLLLAGLFDRLRPRALAPSLDDS